MRPPICAVCHDRDVKGIRLLSFALSEDDKKQNERFKQKGFTGHPAGREWFCEKHAKIAKCYTHLPLNEALPKIKAQFKNENLKK